MKVLPAILAATFLGIGPAYAVEQQSAAGTIIRGTTACVGPLAPDDSGGVQIFGYTNGTSSLTWQVYSVTTDNVSTLVYTARGLSVSKTITPASGLTYEACVSRGPATSEDFQLVLNSTTLG